eukprot:2881153-Amphidinium_carterae.2
MDKATVDSKPGKRARRVTYDQGQPALTYDQRQPAQQLLQTIMNPTWDTYRTSSKPLQLGATRSTSTRIKQTPTDTQIKMAVLLRTLFNRLRSAVHDHTLRTKSHN